MFQLCECRGKNIATIELIWNFIVIKMSSDDLLPWFSPKLSPEVSRLITNLGRRAALERGQPLSASSFFKRLVFVQDGFLAQGVINPSGGTPFMLTLSGPRSFGAATGVVDAMDNLPRRYWAATHCEVLTIIPEILLRLSEVDEKLNQELNSYAIRHLMSERMGLMLCQAASVEERAGVFVVSSLMARGKFSAEKTVAASRWIRLDVLPSRHLAAALLAVKEQQLMDVMRKWISEGALRFNDGAFDVRGDLLAHYWKWMQPFVRMHENMPMMIARDTRHLEHLELDLNH